MPGRRRDIPPASFLGSLPRSSISRSPWERSCSSYLGIGAIAFVLRPRAFRWPDPGALTLGGFWWILLVVYLTFSWTASGRTIGAQVMGLRVTDRSGGKLHAPRALLRAVVCAAFPVGLVWCAIDRRSRALHDLLVGSQVTYDWIPTSA